MAAILPSAPAARIPFGEIHGARLQSLTSTKNRQNALAASSTSPAKRKAASCFDDDDNLLDAENVDPSLLSPKRVRAAGILADFVKPAAATTTTTTLLVKPRKILTPRAQSLKASKPSSRTPLSGLALTATAAPSSAPAGRSPTSKKRIGILNRRRTIQRIEPPSFSLSPSLSSSHAAPCSLGAALAGTIPSYKPRHPSTSRTATSPLSLAPIERSYEPSAPPSSWAFAIHEDSPEETMQILLEHGACTLDLSSDDEAARRVELERGKENVPPPDDASQSQTRLPRDDDDVARSRHSKALLLDECAIDIDRSALGELDARDYYAPDTHQDDVVLVPHDEEADAQAAEARGDAPAAAAAALLLTAAASSTPLPPSSPIAAPHFAFTVEAAVKGKGRALEDVEALMLRTADAEPCSRKARVLRPIERADAGFELWESGSANGDE